MEPVQATTHFQGDRPSRVRPWDLYGAPKESELNIAQSGAFKLDGTWRTYCHLVER